MMASPGMKTDIPDGVCRWPLCRKPVRREELNARIDLHTAMKTDAAWLKSLMNGTTDHDTEAMQLLQAIMPQKIIAKIQVIFGSIYYLHLLISTMQSHWHCASCFVQNLLEDPIFMRPCPEYKHWRIAL